jgi:hypothetical protein
MAEFVQHEIKNHPIVSLEYVKFLATHSPIGELRKLRSELSVTTQLAKSAQSEPKKAVSVAGDAIKKVQIGWQEEAQGGAEFKATGPLFTCAVSQGGSAFGKGTELRGLYVSHHLEGSAEGVIAEDGPVWLSVLPALGITDVAAWGPRPDYITTYFTQECPGLHIVSTKQQLIAKIWMWYLCREGLSLSSRSAKISKAKEFGLLVRRCEASDWAS